MKASTHKFIFNHILGWTGDPLPPVEDKIVILGVPHTSIWDFVVGFFYYRSTGRKLRVMIKKEAFFWPLGPILRHMGAFPIDRSDPRARMVSIIHEMQEAQTFHLCICPEGTRKAVHKWKTGYHTIAKQTGAPVYLACLDFKTKHIKVIPSFPLSDDARKDTDRIQQIYEDLHLTACHPEGYVTK